MTFGPVQAEATSYFIGVNVGSLDLVRPIISSWPAGTLVAPTHYARLEPVQSIAH